MRNILQYPVTQDELIQFVDGLYQEKLEFYKNTLLCGDMGAELLHTILNKLKTGEWKV